LAVEGPLAGGQERGPADSILTALRSRDCIAVIDGRDQLGEGPFWDGARGELLRVDVARGLVHGWNPANGASWRREFAGEVGAAIPRASAPGLVLAVGHRLLLADGDGLRELARVEEDRPDNRFNDCACDAQGRLWAGTMSKRRTPGAAGLYRLAPGGELERVVGETTISNGLGWSPAADRMYFIDSATQRVDAFDFDGSTAAIANRRPFAEIPADDGLPDGLTVDAEGGVWVCLFGGAAIRRYDADGALDAMLELPVSNPTSPVFGGPDLRTLYVTSALAAEPLAGAVLALEPGVRGLPGNRFGG
jgi:sugar lactone lactonase YvrE